MFDLVLRNARIAGREHDVVDIGVRDGRIAAIAAALPAAPLEEDAGGRLVMPGFADTHIHLDKSCLLDRCEIVGGSLQEAITAVARAKRGFSEEDIYARAKKTLEKAILHGTTLMRTHVEADPRIGLMGFRALRQLKRDYAWAIDLELCVFPQEGLLDDPGCESVLVAALEEGADLIGGAPYMDRDSHGQVARIFALAQRFGVDIDFHLDFSLGTRHLDAPEVCRLTVEHGLGGRVAIGHETKLSALPRAVLLEHAVRLSDCGVAVTALPATDLYLMGREFECNVPRGVAPLHVLLDAGVNCAIATNNVLNPFTPFGDCSLLRMANLYANLAQLGSRERMEKCFDLVTARPARLMRRDYGVVVGATADLVVLDCVSRRQAVAEIAPVVAVFKRGKKTVAGYAARLMR